MSTPLQEARALFAACYTAAPSDPWLLRWSHEWLATNGVPTLEACSDGLLGAYVRELREGFREHRAEVSAERVQSA
ncbi:MAG: hypothetical protein ABR532_05835 [Candidatus Dormibacteria bacterium]